MAIHLEIPELENIYLGNTEITDSDLFIYPSELDITAGDLLELVDWHRQYMRPRYLKDKRYFEGKHDIKTQKSKAAYKPDNRLIVNFPKKAVTTYNGFFIGTPVKIDSPEDIVDKQIADWQNEVNFKDISAETSKQASMYGRAFFYVYQDEDGNTCLTHTSPIDTFLIYDDSLAHNVKYGVQYRRNYKNQTEITLIDKQYMRYLVDDRTSSLYLEQSDVTANPYKMIPIIEAPENDERMALCADIMSLIDALDKAMSEKANDVDYFADAYLKILNAELGPEAQKELRDNRLINVTGETSAGATVEFMTKPDADNTQEHLVDRLVDQIYQIASVTNMNDEAFAGNPSGVSLQMKFRPMKDMSNVKSLKFESALRKVFRCYFMTNGIDDTQWKALTFKFTQSVPQNLVELSQAFTNLYGKISNRTLFGQMPFIEDPDKEVEAIKKESKEMAEQGQQIGSDLFTDQQKGGVANADQAAGTSTNNSTNSTRRANGQSN